MDVSTLTKSPFLDFHLCFVSLTDLLEPGGWAQLVKCFQDPSSAHNHANMFPVELLTPLQASLPCFLECVGQNPRRHECYTFAFFAEPVAWCFQVVNTLLCCLNPCRGAGSFPRHCWKRLLTMCNQLEESHSFPTQMQCWVCHNYILKQCSSLTSFPTILFLISTQNIKR